MQRIPHNKVAADESDVAAVTEVVRSGQWAMGPSTLLFEAQLAKACKRQYAVAVGSGLSALRLSLIVLGVKAGDLVGVPAYSCVALANAVMSLGACAIPLDCERDRLTVAPRAVGQDISRTLRCIVVVNTFGTPADFDALRKFEVPLVEDCAHGFGYGQLGNQGLVTVISHGATKFIGSGKGGAVLTDECALADMVRNLRDYDDKPSSALRLNDQPDDLNAALSLSRLNRLNETIQRRHFLANRYNNAFSKTAEGGRIELPLETPGRIWYRYTLRVGDASRWKQRLSANGIECMMPISNWLDERQLASCPETIDAYRSILSLPLFPGLSVQDQDRVIAAITRMAEKNGRST